MSNRQFSKKKKKLASFDLIRPKKISLLEKMNSLLKRKEDKSFVDLLNSVTEKDLVSLGEKIIKTKNKINENIL